MKLRLWSEYRLVFSLILVGGVGCTTVEESRPQALKNLVRQGGATINLSEPALMLGSSELATETFSGLMDERGKIYQALSEKRWDLAIGRCHSFLNQYPGNPKAMLLLASAYAAKKGYAKAGFYAELVL